MILTTSKLRRKVFLKFFILIIAFSFSFIAVFINHQANSQKDNLVNEMMALVKLFAYNSRLGVLTENPEYMKDTIEGIMQREGVVSVLVLTADGRILAKQGSRETINLTDRDKFKGVEPFYIETSNYFEFWASVTTHSNQLAGSQLFAHMESSQTDHVAGYVRIDISKEIISKNNNALLVRGILLAIIFLIIGFIIAYFAAKSVTDPIAKLKEGVATIEKGDFETHIFIKTDDEIEDLGKAINYMAQSLKERENEKQKLMEQLSQAQRLDAIGKFSAGIAHDFNNILTIIQNNLELANSKATEDIQGYLEKSIKASNRGSEIIRNLVSFAHKKALIQETINIGLIAQEMAKMLSGTIDQRIKVNTDIATNLWKIKADLGQVQQVIMNLILNSHDAIIDCLKDESAKDREFSIDVSLNNVGVSQDYCKDNPQASQGDYVLLSIKDNGSGMDMETLPHIFEPFFTTKKHSDKKKSGLGLGLPTVYGIVRQHDGWIDVNSEVGKETTFDVYFPRFIGVDEDIKSSAESYEVAGGTESILLVDDEQHILDAMKEKLEDIGYTVSTANDGETALNMLRNRRIKYDLIVLDHVMPKMTGIEVLRNIKEMRLKSQVLIYSGQDLSQYANILEGVNIISKPLSLDALSDKVREILGDDWKYPLKTQISRVKLHYVGEKTVPYEEQITGSATVYKLFRHLGNEPRETFLAVYLDSQKRIIAYDALSMGTTNMATVYPREVVRTALLTNASSVILVHNHPSGSLKPSQLDVLITADIQQACEVMDIKVHDHIIISVKGHFSFLEAGLMK